MKTLFGIPIGYNIYVYIYKLPVCLSWIRRQTHKQYDVGSYKVPTIKIGLKIIFRSDLI